MVRRTTHEARRTRIVPETLCCAGEGHGMTALLHVLMNVTCVAVLLASLVLLWGSMLALWRELCE